ncbi:hypothetical protein ACNKHL_21195 [Shigella flexneri]
MESVLILLLTAMYTAVTTHHQPCRHEAGVRQIGKRRFWVSPALALVSTKLHLAVALEDGFNTEKASTTPSPSAQRRRKSS